MLSLVSWVSLFVITGAFRPEAQSNSGSWASVWQFSSEQKPMGQYLESPSTGDLLPNGQSKIIVGKIIAIQVIKKHSTSNTLQILLSVYS